MIHINVPFKKCQQCEHFMAQTYFNKSYANDMLIGLETIISCTNQDLCKMLYAEAKTEIEKGNV